MSNCVSKPISALSWATSPLTGEEILPVVQNGENKIILIKDLACKGGHGGGACIAELKCEIDFIKELAKKAMQIADSAFKTACANDAKLAALELIVNQHDTLICEIQRNIQNILNRLETLKDDLKVSISVTESSPNKNYVFNLGNDYVGTVFVPMITSDLVETNGGMAADAAAVARKLPKKLSDLVNDLRFITFMEGKFNENDTQYNGSAARTIHIPVRTSQLINDGDQNGNNFLIGLKDYAGNDVPVNGGIADLSRNDLPVATANKLGAVKLGSDSRTAEGAPLKLNNLNLGMIAPAAADSYGTVKVGGTADAVQKKFPVTLDGNGNAIVNLSTLPTGAETLNDLSDVLTTPQTGDVLYFDGTKWINKSISDLISENLDCQAIQDCFRTTNFNVAPLVVTLEYDERIANFAVTSSGAWKIQKVTSGDNIFTASILDNVHLNSGTNLPLVITANSDNTSGQDREVEWDVIPWITVPGLIETLRIKVILKAQAAPPTPTDRTITYNISGGLTNSIKVNNEVVGNGGQKTAPDGSNYTVPIVSNDPGYKISSVTPSAGTYNVSTGTLTINPITADATVQVVLELIPAGLGTVEFILDTNDSNASATVDGHTITSSLSYTDSSITSGSNYSQVITPASNYEITNVEVSPNGTLYTWDAVNSEVTIPNISNTNYQVHIYILLSLTDPNVYENIDFGANPLKFNSFGVVEGRFIDKSNKLRLTPEVSDPYDYLTYNVFYEGEQDAAPCYESDLHRTWVGTGNNDSMYDITIPVDIANYLGFSDNNLGCVHGEQYRALFNPSDQEHYQNLTWYKDPALVRARLAPLVEHTTLNYLANAHTEYEEITYEGSRASYYEKQFGPNNGIDMLYLVFREDTDSVVSIADVGKLHIYVLLWCRPTDFTNLSHYTENEIGDSMKDWYAEGMLGDPGNHDFDIRWSCSVLGETYTMKSPYLGRIKREEYWLNPHYYDLNIMDPTEDPLIGSKQAIYSAGSYRESISNGYVVNDSDITTGQYGNAPIAAFTGVTYGTTKLPSYTVNIYEFDGNAADGKGSLIQSENINTSFGYDSAPVDYFLDVSISNLSNISLGHKLIMEINAVSTDPSTYPSLKWTRPLLMSDTGAISITYPIGVTVLNTYQDGPKHNEDGGYGRNGNNVGRNYLPWDLSSGVLPTKVGEGYSVRMVDDYNGSPIQTISVNGELINIIRYDNTTPPANLSTDDYYYQQILKSTFESLYNEWFKPPVAFRYTKYEWDGTGETVLSSQKIIEFYIPHVSQTNAITVT